MRLSHPSAAFTALDVSSSQLARAQREAEASGAEVRNSVDASSVGPIEYVQANARHVPSPAAAFDIAVLSYVANELSGVKEREDVMA
jgi:ubiquinone/menaquinone biosynthesis C-methylase UbiE